MNANNNNGDWALITGASRGIGLAFAHQLAAKGWNLILVSRNQTQSPTTHNYLKENFGVQIRSIPMDLSQADTPEEIKTYCDKENIRVRLLINNAANAHLGSFVSRTINEFKLLRLNMETPVRLCRLFYEQLKQNPKGAVINVASSAAYQPVPQLALYAATKVFLYSFSVALYDEWKSNGVLVQTLVPGPTNTDLARQINIASSKLQKYQLSPEEVAMASLKHLEKRSAAAVISHGVIKQRIFVAVAPPAFAARMAGRMFESSKEN